MRVVIVTNVGFAFIVLDVDLSHLVLGPVIWFALDEFPTYGIVCRRRALIAARVQSRWVLNMYRTGCYWVLLTRFTLYLQDFIVVPA